MSVLDRLGAALCEIAPLYLPTGVWLRDDRPALVVPSIEYRGLVNAMFHMIRQNAAGNAAVLIRMLDVLTAVVSSERNPGRMHILQHHADLVMGDAARDISTPADLDDFGARYQRFVTIVQQGPLGPFREKDAE